MSQSDTVQGEPVPLESIQRGWHDLTLRVGQLETERAALERENKDLRTLLERVLEHRQKSHGELINLLSSLVGKMAITDAGVMISRLVEHNNHVAEVCAALAKGRTEAHLIKPAMVRQLDQTKRDLTAAIGPTVEEFLKVEPPLDAGMLRTLVAEPAQFSTPSAVRAFRGFVKGQLPKERILKEFGEAALPLFTDVTTDPKLNPRPKQEDIMLCFSSAFETALPEATELAPDKKTQLQTLHQRVQRSKGATDEARRQKHAFLKLSYILELLYYYEHQTTEAPDVVFAQRLPPIIEQLAAGPGQESLDERLVAEAEALLNYIITTDHRLSVINNVGKGGGVGKSLKFVLRFRSEKAPMENQSILHEVMPDFVKHLVTPPPQTVAQQQGIAAVLRFLVPELQRLALKSLLVTDRLQKPEAEALGKTLSRELGVSAMEEARPLSTMTPEMERQLGWEKVKDLITSRGDPAAIATGIRERLHAKYDSDEIKHSWLVITEADAMTFIRAFCQLPYLANGKTDTIAQPVLESYVNRLMHEKYAATYTKVVNSLKNMHKAKPDSPTLLNFLSLIRWTDTEAAAKLAADIGMHAAHA